jgi:hypothetical protein
LVDLTELRWRTEGDYQELKQELGLGDYEGRGWRGFHHHAKLYVVAYGFLIAERGAIPPQDQIPPRNFLDLPFPRVNRPRGAADPTRTPHPKLDRHHTATPNRRSRQNPTQTPLLQCSDPQNGKISRLPTE